MGSRGFVSKNHGLGKPDHWQRSATGRQANKGIMVQFAMKPRQTRPKPSFVRYASLAGPDNVSRSSAVLASFAPLVRVLKKKLKTTLDRPTELR
jgi:hypothetical protein